MNDEQIRQRLSNGFHPFQLHLTNGRKIEVPHPDFIAVRDGTVAVLGENGIASIIDALHVVSIDDLPATRP
jgi:hypothetical protein